MSENGEMYTAGKNFTLPPALTAWTNSTSDISHCNEKMSKILQTAWATHLTANQSHPKVHFDSLAKESRLQCKLIASSALQQFLTL